MLGESRKGAQHKYSRKLAKSHARHFTLKPGDNSCGTAAALGCPSSVVQQLSLFILGTSQLDQFLSSTSRFSHILYLASQ